jgi:hypothetical protein
VICSNVNVVRVLAETGAGIALTLHADLSRLGSRPEGGSLVPVLPDLVRAPRAIRVKITDEVADIPAFRSLMGFTRRMTDQIGRSRGPAPLTARRVTPR